MFLTAVKLLSLKLQTKHPGFCVYSMYTLLIAELHPSPVKGLAQRALCMPKLSKDLDCRLHFLVDFVIVSPNFSSIL